ncbi:hypothetical protein BJ944DRAFT_268707 [Cunninghamella echinulata]|nr:hypothetical protein BJ944DRAFT_268707 [Cunninghamella echinulata]
MRLSIISGLVVSTIMAIQTSAVSVHNWWKVPNGVDKIQELTSSIRVPSGSDPTNTYWMANGWVRGYMGMQHNSGTERRFLFSVWDDGKNSKVNTIQVGKGVVDENFGGEGTGAHGYLKTNWKVGETVQFRVTADVNEEKQTTVYSGYFKRQGQTEWNLLVSYEAERTTQWLSSPYGFLENFGPDRTKLREGFYGNCTMKDTQGKTYQSSTFDFTHTTPDGKDVWEQRTVSNEAYMRIDGKKSQGIYPPTNTK